ncbi:MAG: tetratricopeptide repeat protein [Bacteroidota bacterium]|nr:tetratricopeptide repeat protein [Bacteroidota bacterium]
MGTYRFAILFIAFSIVMTNTGFSQVSESGYKKDGDNAYDAGDFRSALQYYRQAGLEDSRNSEMQLRFGISMYDINDIDGAIGIFQSLINEGKTEAPVFLYMAKCYQALRLFQDAISYYKKFLQRAEGNNPLRTWVKDELTRCANGSRLKYADEEAYVENAGPIINTQYDEYGVKNSPTVIDKIYFNSNRTATASRVFSDIYSASLLNGNWSEPTSLPPNINTTGANEVSGFSADGQILYFLTSTSNGIRIMTDTFSGEEGIVYRGEFKAPFDPSREGADITFFNDSICLFSSNRPGGFGGYDLYISVSSDRQWSTPVNLGPAINTFYNERFAFLTRNGETLFYASDNLESIGGYDIFKTIFDPETLKWSFPVNLGFPVNSSLDDTHLALSPDGLTAFISSNRKEGHGGYDLYSVFFKQPVQSHQQISFVPTFYQTMILNGSDQVTTELSDRPVEVKEYFISHLFIDENGEILTPQNIKKLDLLANLLLIYPEITTELTCFELPTNQRTFNLFFSIKKAEKASEYLVRKGVASNRILLKGFGSSFPLAKNPPGGTKSAVTTKLNHRLEISLHNFENEPVITHLENIPVPENLLDPQGAKFLNLRRTMYFSVQIASITQILQNAALEPIEELYIDVDPQKGNYRYMVGMTSSFKEIEKTLTHMQEIGFADAFIVPYFNGLRIQRDELPGMAAEYPELLLYYSRTK